MNEVPTINPEVFFQANVRAGTILEAAEFPQARKAAYKLLIDFGPLGKKWSSAQITDLYGLEILIGRQVIAVLNLPVRSIAGFKSECLILGLPGPEGSVILLQPEQPVANGARVY